MGRLCISIAWVEDNTPIFPLIELSRTSVPTCQVSEQVLSQSLDALEQQTVTIGPEVMRHLFCQYWDLLEQQYVGECFIQFASEGLERNSYAS